MAKSHLKLVAPSTEKRTVTPTTPSKRRTADARVPDRDRDREADQGSQAQPLGPPGRHHDLGGLPPRPQGVRAGGPALGPDRLRHAPPCTSAGSSRAHPAPIRSSATNCGPCAGYSASRSRSRHSCSRPNAARRSPRRALPAWWSALVRRPSWASRRTRTCCATPAASRWPTRATIRAPCRPTSATSNIQHTVRYTELAPDRFKDFWR